MVNTPDISILKEDNGIRGESIDTYLDCRLWIDSEEKGNLIPISSVKNFTLEENMFKFLPTATFIVQDAGRLFNLDNMYYGRKLIIKVRLKSRKDEHKTSDYIKGTFSIVDWTQSPDIVSKNFVYRITAVFDYEGLYNDIHQYPPDGGGNKTSTQVIKDILEQHGIDTEDCDANTNDAMCWINCFQTDRDFIQKVVSHSYIDDKDSAFFWIDICGKAHYKSMKSIIEDPSDHKYINNYMYGSFLAEQKQEDWEEENQTTLLYNQVYSQNVGGLITSQGGGTQKPHVYNCISKFSNKFINTDKNDGNAYSDKYLTYNVSQKDPILATYSNMVPEYKEKINIGGIAETHFDDTHEYYDVAPYINDNYRRSLFQYIWDMTIDINKQPNPIYESMEKLPHIGQKINVRFGGDKSEKVPKFDGSYIITAIRYGITGNSSLNARISFACDGTYDKGI